MKATGIVRRVDDLGRIVIPKEISTYNIDILRLVLQRDTRFRTKNSSKVNITLLLQDSLLDVR